MISSEEESSTDESIIIFGVRKNIRPLLTSSSSEEVDEDESSSDEDELDNCRGWNPINQDGQKSGVSWEEELLHKHVDCDDPFELYKLFITNDIFEQIIIETNRYVEQCLCNGLVENVTRKHQKKWKPVALEEEFSI